MRTRLGLAVLFCASCMLNGDALKQRVRAALLECAGEDAETERCAEVAGSTENATATRDVAVAFRGECGEIREVTVDDWASINQRHSSDDGWSWDPGCAAGRVIADHCHGHFRFEVGLLRAGPAIGPVDFIRLVALDAVAETSPSDRHRCPRDARGIPTSYRPLPPPDDF